MNLVAKVEKKKSQLIVTEVSSGRRLKRDDLDRLWGYLKKQAYEHSCHLERKVKDDGSYDWSLIEPTKKRNDNMSEKSEKMTDERVRELLSDAINKKPNELVIAEASWKLGSRAVLRGQNILFLGHSGCGKTLTSKCLAKGWNRPFFKFNMGAMQDARSSLIGNTHYSPEKGTFFAGSDFVKAIQTPNAYVLLDEITRMSHDAENIMITVLDPDQRYLRIDEDPNTPVIEVAEGVTFGATANIGTEYTSTRQLDRATKDRFSTIIEVPLLDDEEEYNLLKKLFRDVNPNYLKAFADIADHTRKDKQSDDPQYMTLVSTRSTVQQADLAKDGFYFSEIMEALVFPMFDSEGGMDSDRTKIRQFVQKYTHLDKESPLKAEQRKADEEEKKKRNHVDLDDEELAVEEEIEDFDGKLFDPNEDSF